MGTSQLPGSLALRRVGGGNGSGVDSGTQRKALGAPSSARWAPSPRREGRELKARAAGLGMGRDSFPPAPPLLREVEIQILGMGAGSRAACGGTAGLPRVLGRV